MQILRLANEDQSTLIDLLAGNIIRLESGWESMTPGMGGAFTYEPFGAQFDFENYQPQQETFTLNLVGRTAAVLNELDRLQDFIESVRLFHAGDLAAPSCWLEWQAEGEELKRSLLYSAGFKVTSRDDVTPGRTCKILGTLSLSRHPLWETPVQEILATGIYDLDTLGGQMAYADMPGNTLGRIWLTMIQPTAGLYHHLYRFWIGIRRYNQGVANLETLWECEDGTIIDALDTSDVADASASGGTRRQITFANDATLIRRFIISVQQVCAAAGHADYDHQQGRYLVLLRCRVTGGGTAGIEMHSGYTGNIVAEEIYVDNPQWMLKPLGNISIPPWQGTDFSTAETMRFFNLEIYAEELDTCDLYTDCFVLIPNEHLLEAEGWDVLLGGLNQDDTLYVLEDDLDVAVGRVNFLSASEALEYALTEWYIPPGEGVIVAAGEDEFMHTIGDDIDLTLYIYPRWTLYRGE